MTVEMPDPRQVTLPPASQLRSQLAGHLRAAHILRGLLRLAESVDDADGKPELSCPQPTNRRGVAANV